MITLPGNVILEKNKVSTASAWLCLVDIVLNDDAATTFRLVRNTENITYGGNIYQAFSFDLKPVVLDSKGTIPVVELAVSNITHVLQPYLLQLRGGVGSVVKLTVVNSAHLSENYSELEMLFNIIGTVTTLESVIFRLGALNPLVQRFPLHKFVGLHCGWPYKLSECGYTYKSIVAINLTTPVAVEITNHGWSTDDVIELTDCNGITGLDGIFTITNFSAHWIQLQDTVGANYSGSYTGGGSAGYAYCNRTLSDCRIRGRSTQFGGFPGMRSKSIRLV